MKKIINIYLLYIIINNNIYLFYIIIKNENNNNIYLFHIIIKMKNKIIFTNIIIKKENWKEYLFIPYNNKKKLIIIFSYYI